ncbi:MAG: hypothetical protein IPM24_28040 [Bryobacterales bacterium]|nr:hypothetical protein [Bryobacterales bacterium]
MRCSRLFTSAIQTLLALAGSAILWAQPPQGAAEIHGLPARAAPVDYQAAAQVGQFTIAADFTGHAIPNAGELLSSEDHVAVEVAIFGPPGAHLTITATDFSLRVNRKKGELPSQPWVLVSRNIRDPEWVSPEEAAAEPKSKGGVTGGGGGGGGGGREMGAPPPLPPKVPVDVLRGWQQRLGRAAIAEGDRALPQAGLLFFQYRGKTESVRTLELLYEGPAGKAALKLR